MKKLAITLTFFLLSLLLTGCSSGDGLKKPFWAGTGLVQVCKKPYYSSDDCYELNVYMQDDGEYAQIYFPNGGYIITEDIQCYEAAQVYEDQSEYVFCRSWDNEGSQWDFMPTWVNPY